MFCYISDIRHYITKTMPMSSTLLFSLLMAASVCIGTGKSGHNDQCTIYQGGCKYRVALTHSECMSSDQPGSHSVGESNFITHLVSGKPVIPVHPPEVNPMETNNIHQELPTERLDELEKKLTKMMEGLSVRSLRHIRQIRNDLRQLSESMSLLGTSNREGGSKRKRKAPEPTPPVSCPDEFSSVGTWASCYRFSTFNSTWHEAREYCSALGSNLVSLESLQESYILNYLIKSNPGKHLYLSSMSI